MITRKVSGITALERATWSLHVCARVYVCVLLFLALLPHMLWAAGTPRGPAGGAPAWSPAQRAWNPPDAGRDCTLEQPACLRSACCVPRPGGLRAGLQWPDTPRGWLTCSSAPPHSHGNATRSHVCQWPVDQCFSL